MDTSTTAAPADVPDRVELKDLTPAQQALMQHRYPDLHAALVAPPAPPPEGAS